MTPRLATAFARIPGPRPRVEPPSFGPNPRADPRLQLYLSYRQPQRFGALPFMSIAVRTQGEPLRMTRTVRAAVQSVDKDMPLSNVKSMDNLIGSSVGQRRLSMILLGTFSAIALLLASIGIYGVMSYSVAQRGHEIGIRMALGAFAPTRLLGNQLYSVTPTDPGTFAAVAAMLTTIALGATLPPALRATRVDPVVALRGE